LNTGDQIVALDGMRVTRESLLARIGERRPGDILNLTIFRNDDLRNISIKLGGQIPPDYRILPVKQPTPEQTRLKQAWLSTTAVN
jgi:predicted metalloprotease with PDZ domain